MNWTQYNKRLFWGTNGIAILETTDRLLIQALWEMQYFKGKQMFSLCTVYVFIWRREREVEN